MAQRALKKARVPSRLERLRAIERALVACPRPSGATWAALDDTRKAIDDETRYPTRNGFPVRRRK